MGFRVYRFRVLGIRVLGFRVWGFRVLGFGSLGLGVGFSCFKTRLYTAPLGALKTICR